MSSRIQNVQGTAAEKKEIARFLAGFVRSGQLENPRIGDDSEAVWEQRLGWWWDGNPMCRDDSPLGFRLVDDSDRIVGFHGFIPVDYEIDGEPVPSLLATTFFVEDAHRDAVMGILMRVRALGRSYQIVDGSASDNMRELLDRLGFSKCGERFQFFFPITPIVGVPSQMLLSGIGLSSPVGSLPPGDFYLANRPEEIEKIPASENGLLGRRITVESLSWIVSVGHDPRSFFGLCDEEGTLQAYAIGIYKKKYGVTACMLLDFRDYTEDRSAGGALLTLLCRKPRSSGVARGTGLITWSILSPGERPARQGLRRESNLYFSLPRPLSECRRASAAIESDIYLL